MDERHAQSAAVCNLIMMNKVNCSLYVSDACKLALSS